MYKLLRNLHKVSGLVGSLFLVTISVTGFVLALKAQLPNVRPATQKGAKIERLSEAVHPSVALEAALGVGLPLLAKLDDVDRFEYHAGKNVYKIHSVAGYHEVQVDGGSGKVLQVGRRNDQFMEDVHDLSIFHPALREVVLPVIGVVLFFLGVSGVVMYFVPVARRIKHRRSVPAARV